MKRKELIVAISILLVLIFVPLYAYANTLTLNLSVDKEDAKLGDEIHVKVSWDKDMQAADFYLKYDSKKLEYIKSDIDDVFINNDVEEGALKTAWVSMDNTDKTDIVYTFKVKSGGKIKFTTAINGGFATGELEVPDAYNEGELIIKIPQNYTAFCIVVLISIIVIIIIFIMKGRRKNKENTKLKKH